MGHGPFVFIPARFMEDPTSACFSALPPGLDCRRRTTYFLGRETLFSTKMRAWRSGGKLFSLCRATPYPPPPSSPPPHRVVELGARSSSERSRSLPNWHPIALPLPGGVIREPSFLGPFGGYAVLLLVALLPQPRKQR